MVYTSNENTSSFWFMTSTADSHNASGYWHKIGQELDLESHLATVKELGKARFPVYICQQKVGDFIIVPPKSCHQVINSGGMTMKVSWSRMTARSLELALKEELPIYRRYGTTFTLDISLNAPFSVCRSEVYRVKALIFATLVQTISALDNFVDNQDQIQRREGLLLVLQKLLPLFLQMVEESSIPSNSHILVQPLEAEVCGFCGADIWQSALVCNTCTSDDGSEKISICPPCYVDGRSCLCKRMRPVQSRSQQELLDIANAGIRLLLQYERDNQQFHHILAEKCVEQTPK
jgi:hypothetical protein